MESIRAYIITVISAGIITTLVTSFVKENKSSAAAIRLIAGVFLSVTIISPLAVMKLSDFSDYWSVVSDDSHTIISEGTQLAANAKKEIIIEKSEQYILDKAKALDLSISVDVFLSNEAYPKPYEVHIEGSASPYARKRLQSIIATDIGIEKEQQVWN